MQRQHTSLIEDTLVLTAKGQSELHTKQVVVILHDACWDLTTKPKHRCYPSNNKQKYNKNMEQQRTQELAI